MPKSEPHRRRWVGFLVGLLVFVLPAGGYFLLHRLHRAPPGRDGRPPASRPRGNAPAASETARPLRISGESLADPQPPPDDAAIRESLARAEHWLRGFHVDPFGAAGTDSLRTFALEAECWHRLGAATVFLNPSRARSIEGEIRSRLRAFADAERVAGLLRTQGTIQGMLEILLLTGRCRDHGIDVEPLLALIRSMATPIGGLMDRLPPSTAALYAASLARIGIDIGRPLSQYESIGVMAARPREIDLGIAKIYGLTQEIFARTSNGDRPLAFQDPTERIWLQRVLPYLEITCARIRNHEAAGDLLSCLNVAMLDSTYGYREGLRVLISRQNKDGSYGDAAGAGRARIVSLLPSTASAITALSLEARRGAGGWR